MLNFIVGREKTDKGLMYLVCSYSLTSVTFKSATEAQLISALRGGTKFQNAELQDNSLKGNPASLSRFDKQPKPYVILARLVDDVGNVLGFHVATPSGEHFKARNDKILDYCKQVSKLNGVPFQNAIFVADETESSFIKSYPNCPFPSEVLKRVVNKHALPVTEKKIEKPKLADVLTNELKMNISEEASKVASRYTKEQRAQLKLGIKSNVNIWNYADPDISWQKMKVLRLAMERGYDVTALSDRKYIIPVDLNALMYTEMVLEQGIDIAAFINPEYNTFQLQEIYTGIIHYIDINEYSDPKIPAQEMAKIRDRLETYVWHSPIGGGGV